MTEGHPSPPKAAGFAITSLTAVMLAAAAPAAADPAPPTPAPPAPGATSGQPVVSAEGPSGPLPPPPPAAPPVPEIANPVYGSGQYGSGPLGTIRDLWHQAHDPYSLDGPSGPLPDAPAPPPGAGPAPKLPPGFISLNAPGSETASTAMGPAGSTAAGGPPLPPGYHSLSEPPPPGWFDAPPGTVPAAAATPAAPSP